MKLLKILPLTLILFASCSSDDNNSEEPNVNGEAATKFVGTFYEKHNSETIVVDTYYNAYVWNQLNNIVPNSTEEYDQSEESKVVDHYETTYTLLLASSSAKLDIDTETFTKEITTQYHVTKTAYTPGRYIVELEDNYYFNYIFVVDESAIYSGFILKDTGEITDEYDKLADLENGNYITKTALSSTDGEITSTNEHYSGIFNVVTEPTGVSILKNSAYTFNFLPTTGMLTEIEPDYNEIGELDRE
jgi:hypothetical protein